MSNNQKTGVAVTALFVTLSFSEQSPSAAFSTPPHASLQLPPFRQRLDLQLHQQVSEIYENDCIPLHKRASRFLSSAATTAALSAALLVGATGSPAFAENELSELCGGGFDSSLVDTSCFVDNCSLQAKACLADDPDCRKGLTCITKCMVTGGESTCVQGCMAQYLDKNLENMFKCTIEDNSCIKVAILDGGADKFGEEPLAPAPAVSNFNANSMEGQWYKVVGFNPIYDCYACQRNTFTNPNDGGLLGANLFGSTNDKLQMEVEFSMMKMMPNGAPPPPTNERETVKVRKKDGLMYGSRAIGFNDYQTKEVMIFDQPQDVKSKFSNLVLGKGTKEATYQRTAHSEGEMQGLKFWENWYVIGENDPGTPEFKLVYYNGKTRQNTYEGAFVYSRTKELDPVSMRKVYQIASDAGLNPDQACKIRNGCFGDDEPVETKLDPLRGIIASTKVSQLLGVESVAAETSTKVKKVVPTPEVKRHWWQEVGDYLEDPNQHFRAMDSLRETMDWSRMQ